ncbi:hypothetical protein NFI96_021001 [Prochilodus magdalenae]|nr:hypothetical protein NFI96_021001 [Prochilodus magdalenae]
MSLQFCLRYLLISALLARNLNRGATKYSTGYQTFPQSKVLHMIKLRRTLACLSFTCGDYSKAELPLSSCVPYFRWLVGLFMSDDFDPLTIAKKLRELGDHYDENVIQPLMKDVRAAAQDQVKTTFCNSVENLSKMWVTESAEVAPEKQLLKATITLAVYMRNNCPDMTDVIKEAASTIINTRLSSWILQQGGWKMASGSCN